MVLVWGLRQPVPEKNPKVIIGTRDMVYYANAATEQDARVLGLALRSMGFFQDSGASVFLSKGKSGTVVSFVLQAGAWDLPDRISSYEEIGRRIATPIGGFPIKVRLIDSTRAVHRELTVGKATIGAKDEVYYFGDATQADAEALGQALREAGFLADRGASVELSKGGRTTISFVVNDGAWEQPAIVNALAGLTRRAAASVGGLPVTLRLLNSNMESEKEAVVQ